MSDYPYEAKRTVQALIEVLEPFVECDPEQEIRGIAVPLVEAGFDAVRAALPGDPVVVALVVPCANGLETGEPVRFADALLVASQLDAALGEPPTKLG